MAFLHTSRHHETTLSWSNQGTPSSSIYHAPQLSLASAKEGTRWLVTVLGLSITLLYMPVLWRLAKQVYGDPAYSHALLIPFFCAFLVWRRREQWRLAEKKPSTAGLILVLAAIALLYIASIGAELFLSRISLVMLVAGIVLFVWGRVHARVVAFPLTFLLFAFPLPALLYNQLVLPLQLLSSRLATAGLEHMTTVPVLREGNVLILPHCSLEVVEACSGIRSLMALVALAAGYAYLTERNNWVRTALVTAMIPIAIVGNGARVVCVALLANYLGARTVDSLLHPVSGVVIFLVSVTMLLALHFGISTMLHKFAGTT